MKNWLPYWIGASLALLLANCGSSSSTPVASTPDPPPADERPDPQPAPPPAQWLIPASQVRDGGPGKDGIPAIEHPQFDSGWAGADYLREEDLVVVFRPAGSQTVRVYPHLILNWHEIVNEEEQGLAWSVTYCPLTGSTVIVDRRQINRSTLGVSGLLFNNNLIMYDRGTDSYWSQMMLQSVRGEFAGFELDPLPYLETTRATAEQLFPQAQVLSRATGHSRPYGQYPYGSYRTNSSLLFPMGDLDNRLHPKERVLGVLAGGSTTAYRLESGTGFVLSNERVGDQAVVVLQAPDYNLAVAYRRDSISGGTLTFTEDASRTDLFPYAMQDEQTGSIWNFLGEAVDGPLKGTRLQPATAMIAYWFAWAAFYPDTQLIF